MVINPKGTASWLIDNTALTFSQIADFCELHEMEVNAIANGDVEVTSVNPILTNQIEQKEIEKGEKNEHYALKLNPLIKELQKKSKHKYKSVSKRHLVTCCVFYVVKKFPEAKDSKVASICGSTKSTVARIRDGSYKFLSSLEPKNPVLVGLCMQRDLDELEK